MTPLAQRIADTYTAGNTTHLFLAVLKEEEPDILEQLDRASQGNVRVGTFKVGPWKQTAARVFDNEDKQGAYRVWSQHYYQGKTQRGALTVSCTLLRDPDEELAEYVATVQWCIEMLGFSTFDFNVDTRHGLPKIPPAFLRRVEAAAETIKQREMAKP